MLPFVSFSLGVAFMGCLLIVLRRKWKNKNKLLTEQKNQLAQEKEIAVEFMHNLAEAIGEGIDKKVLYQRIVHTAVISTGAMSASIYEKLPNGRLKGVAVEGLFPPQRAIKQSEHEAGTPRARFIEKILNSEILESGEGIVGQVAANGKAVFVPRAMDDPRIIKHEDASLAVRSMIFSPLIHDDKILGVLAVANPPVDCPFQKLIFLWLIH